MREVAKDPVISTVDPEGRHSHKSRNRRFDGYKAHLSIDPDSELIDEAVGTPANTPDRDTASDLLAPLATMRTSPKGSGIPPMPTGPPTWKTRASPSRPSARRCATPPDCSPKTASASISKHKA